MGCITSTTPKSPPEICTPQQVQINIIAASKTPSFASSISCEQKVSSQAAASPSVVDGLASVAMARSVSQTSQDADVEPAHV
ncbi:hypothetical protein JTE90_002787 [Oedothorax gibbosus]|uniref:Uncharacterized protein n=1 Tax=Oedothorax gibbosus TaxID=931172 RepID=A0AAV6UHY5_9ARAC|nr:hypothetical protein JTE90_002787 [Oedothorax gibbosus]